MISNFLMSKIALAVKRLLGVVKINGLDISSYQENPQYNLFINWIELKADPRNFRFIWIKCSEGTDYVNYKSDATRQVIGAKSVKFEAINPYHFYLYQIFIPAEDKWVPLSAIDQAQTFFSGAVACGFPHGTPMVDLEDPSIRQFLVWTDTASANKALAFARGLAAHVKKYLEETSRLFEVKPDAYSGKWWYDLWVPMLISNGFGSEVAFLKDYYHILADYDGELNIPSYIPVDKVRAWQRTSSPMTVDPFTPVRGIPTGRAVAGDALDCDEWLLSETEFAQWSGTGVTMTTSIYNFEVPQLDRFRAVTYKPSQTLAVPIKDLGVRGVFLPMVSCLWDGNHWQVISEPTFYGRCNLFLRNGVLPVGRIKLSAAFWLREGHTSVEVLSQSCLPEMTDIQKEQSIRDNLILPKIMANWCVGSWTWDMIFAKQVKFLDLRALEIQMTEKEGTLSSPANDYWQTITFKHVVNCLRFLMIRGCIPSIPIILYTGIWWLIDYPLDFMIALSNSKSWLYLHIGQWVLSSEANIQTLSEIFNSGPLDSFYFSSGFNTDGTPKKWSIPDGYADRILFHEFTGETQSCAQIPGSTVDVSKGNDRTEAIEQILGGAFVQTSASLSMSSSSSVSSSISSSPSPSPSSAPSTVTNEQIMQELLDLRSRVDQNFSELTLLIRSILDKLNSIFK